ncbi:MAG: hypothetical protein JEZ06_17925 [Anaerolineaceae bacterium]|nr:hypothetical protein [Anaerolineaceae bacterium]
MNSIREKLLIPDENLAAINDLFLDPNMEIINRFVKVVEKYGSPEEINAQAKKNGKLENLLGMVKDKTPEYYDNLQWLMAKKKENAFVSVADYQEMVLGEAAKTTQFSEAYAVTLEISAYQYFPWMIDMVKDSIENRKLIPGRFIRVRKMKEQEADGDLAAVSAAMKIMGSSIVETLDTKGTDGSNVHLGGPDTITGYFGGVGQPNEYALKWLDEFLYYYTHYGVRQVLNVNPGTVLLGYLLHKIGVDIEFKISVFMGNDNPFAAFWTLIGAKLFSRADGTTPLIGFNWSNSVNNETIELTSQFRKSLDLESVVRFEHHITETYKHIVRQPYNKRDELLEIAGHVANISAKHEGGDPEIDMKRDYPSDILDYFRDKDEIIQSGDWDNLKLNFMDKYDAVNRTAWELTKNGLSFKAASELHK